MFVRKTHGCGGPLLLAVKTFPRWQQSYTVYMPATAAMIERCNKSYALTKTKQRNRLSSERAAKLAMCAYNLKFQRQTSESELKRSAQRIQRNNIMALPIGPTSTSNLPSPSDISDDVESEDE